MLSIPHMIVLFVVVLVVFGPQKLPELARNLGKLMAEFRRASTDFKSAFEEEMREMERQTLAAERKKHAEAVAATAAASQQALPAPDATSSEATASSSDASGTAAAASEPVISPVQEAIARSSEESAAGNTPATAVTGTHESTQEHLPPV